MVDKERRIKLALHLRQLSTGQISNDEFEEKVMDDVTFGWLPEQYYRAEENKQDDAAIAPILEFSWYLYNDTYNHKLKGRHKLSEEQIKEIAMLILFLYSDLEYQWNYIDITNPVIRFSFKDMLKSVLTLGQHYRDLMLKREEEIELMKKAVGFEYWPFKTEADFKTQLKKQPYLVGKENTAT